MEFMFQHLVHLLNHMMIKKDKIKLQELYYNKYFKDSQFTCKCGCGQNKMNRQFLYRIAQVRHNVYLKTKQMKIKDIPFNITSGYRCIAHNMSLDNASPNSSHLLGIAIDISCTSSRSRYIIITQLIKGGFNRIGIGSTFIHVDANIKNSQVIWTY